MPIASIDPATGATLRTFQPISDAELEAALARAHAAAPRWRATPLAERLRVVARAGEILDAEKRQFGELMTREMGKPLQAAIDEAAKCATACRYYVEHGEAILTPTPVVEDDGEEGYVAYEPLGVVLAIMPWNFPFWQVIRFAAPALTAGNVGLLKHASNVPQCALALADIFRRAGAPEGVFQSLLLESRRVAGVIADPRVAAVTLTGSEGAGRQVGSAAGQQLKPSVLELGGSDPFVVMPSANLEQAVKTAVRARTVNNGQSCIAAKRFIVHERVYDEFTRRFVAEMEALKVGDPMDPATQIGPLATPQILEDVDEQVQATVRAGATLLTGGRRLDRPGNFYAPTVLADVPRDAEAAREEVFGPVAAVFRVRDIDEAIALANATRFGLGASAWTTEGTETRRFAAGLAAGLVFINAMVASDPRFPFGGVKASGYGRELADIGLREFVNVKTVRITRASEGRPSRTE